MPLAALVAVTATALAFRQYATVEWRWFALGWVGLVPWLAALDRVRTLRAAAALGLLMCVAFVLAVFAWFAVAITTYTDLPLPASFVVLAVIAPALQPQFITFAVMRHLARVWSHDGNQSPTIGQGSTATFQVSRAAMGACFYVGTEWMFPKLLGDTLGHGFYASAWMRQAADLGGAHGLTFVLVFANECCLGIVRAVFAAGSLGTRARRALKPVAIVVGLAVALSSYGALRLWQFESPGGDTVRVGVVQGNIGQYAKLAADLGTYEATRKILNTYFSMSSAVVENDPVDFLVWPETVYPTTFGSPKSEDGAAFDREIAAFVSAAAVPLVFGAYDREGGDEFNAAVFLSATPARTASFDTYRKVWLFPLIEFVPAVLEHRAIRRWFPWLGTWRPGPGAAVVELILPSGRILRIAPLLCYDAVVPSHAIAAVRRGAELIITLSNDSWFADGGGPRLHLVVSAFRSIETRRAQVRATNTGISAIISATGELQQQLGSNERGVLVQAVAMRPATTVMLLLGDWSGLAALLAGAALLVSSRFRSSRNQKERIG